MKDYYEILEVSRNASENTIKKVFRLLIKNNHPDLYTGAEKTKAEKRVKDLNEAYEVLSNKEKRKEYDNELAESNLNKDEIIKTLTIENEYLKSVIEEKNKIFKEYLEEMGMNIQAYDNQFSEDCYDDKESLSNEYVKNKEQRMYYSYYETMKNIFYIVLIIIIGLVILKILK